jgi:hypothetical protein
MRKSETLTHLTDACPQFSEAHTFMYLQNQKDFGSCNQISLEKMVIAQFGTKRPYGVFSAAAGIIISVVRGGLSGPVGP